MSEPSEEALELCRLDAGPLGELELEVPAARQAITPASRVTLETLAEHAGLFAGRGVDWGCGVGALCVAAARIPAVEGVLGLELDPRDVPIARANAARNGVADEVQVFVADSFRVRDPAGRAALEGLRGRLDFLVANPPASRSGDGLDWRREVLRGARELLVPGAPVLLQISYQYSLARIAGLAEDVSGYTYAGELGSSEWVPFDQRRADLSRQLVDYAAVEEQGGLPYTFAEGLDARAALARFRSSGASPLSKWQVHLYRRA
ncbi:MAG TPA: methyltransferase [Planctomycetes bacterium]|nr:methyltransferase [Planctomycetota bacterium]